MLNKQIIEMDNGSSVLSERKAVRRSSRVKDTKLKSDRPQRSLAMSSSNDTDTDNGSATEYNPDIDEEDVSITHKKGRRITHKKRHRSPKKQETRFLHHNEWPA